MLKLFVAIPALLFLSACSYKHYTTSSISAEINNRSDINHVGEGIISNSYGSHKIFVEDIVYNVIKIDPLNEVLHLTAKGLVTIVGAPYASSPTFVADIHGKAIHGEDGKLRLNIKKASNIKLEGISDLHLYGIRDKVKDIIAITMIEKEDITLHEVFTEEGDELKIWRF